MATNVTKKIETWEREKGMMLVNLDGRDLSDRVTEDDFMKLAYSEERGSNSVGVTFEDREKFLSENGYELTRENMMNGELSVREKSDDAE